jgi:hypothetical protein
LQKEITREKEVYFNVYKSFSTEKLAPKMAIQARSPCLLFLCMKTYKNFCEITNDKLGENERDSKEKTP